MVVAGVPPAGSQLPVAVPLWPSGQLPALGAVGVALLFEAAPLVPVLPEVLPPELPVFAPPGELSAPEEPDVLPPFALPASPPEPELLPPDSLCANAGAIWPPASRRAIEEASAIFLNII